ncbi:hypothetical protein L2E82_47684 [Cichorium intybus]|uniref:Uncharacterized protein n=1 Tax=Cichorium intybus TaxID=13427 RepID=A0ACB8YX87_CICIN|nr:hypothetical protein L2E82_47684 [Cichorium intybus]
MSAEDCRAQFENVNVKSNEKFKEEIKFKYKESQKEDNPMEDPTQEAERKSPSAYGGSSSKLLEIKSPASKAELEYEGVQRIERPNLLNGVFVRLNTLLSRDTPIKEKLEGNKAKKTHSKELENHSMGNEGDI